MRKKILLTIVMIMILSGIVFACVPFVGALKPPANAGENLPAVDVSKLENGDFIIYDSEADYYFKPRYLIIKGYDSKIRVFEYPTRGYVRLPDYRWYRWGPRCQDFGPETVNGKLKPNGMILCKDKEALDWLSDEMHWDYNGENLGKYTEDMNSTKFKIKGHFLYLHHG